MNRFDGRLEVEFLGSQVSGGAHDGRAELELTRPCLRCCYQFADGLDAGRFAHDKEKGLVAERGNRAKVLQRVIRKVRQELGAVCVSAAVGEQRVTVGRRFRDQGGANRAACTSVVLDCHGLAQQLGELSSDGAGNYVNPTAGAEWLDHAHRLRRIPLEERAGRRERSNNKYGEEPCGFHRVSLLNYAARGRGGVRVRLRSTLEKHVRTLIAVARPYLDPSVARVAGTSG